MSYSVNSVRRVLVLKYRGHRFYEDFMNEDAPLIHIDPQGRETVSECYSEVDAMEYVDGYEENKGA